MLRMAVWRRRLTIAGSHRASQNCRWLVWCLSDSRGPRSLFLQAVMSWSGSMNEGLGVIRYPNSVPELIVSGKPTSTMLRLSEFRTGLSELMQSEHERPFVCSGSPVTCSVFLVGFNPATRLESSFWSFWNDSQGFDRSRFVNEYERLRTVEGVRLRLNAMMARFPLGAVLETNICSEPTKRAVDLKLKDRRTDIFRFLLATIQPRIVFLHSNEPIKFFRTLLDNPRIDLPHHALVDTSAVGLPVKVCVSEGPLWRKKVAEMATLAGTLSEHVDPAHVAG